MFPAWCGDAVYGLCVCGFVASESRSRSMVTCAPGTSIHRGRRLALNRRVLGYCHGSRAIAGVAHQETCLTYASNTMSHALLHPCGRSFDGFSSAQTRPVCLHLECANAMRLLAQVCAARSRGARRPKCRHLGSVCVARALHAPPIRTH